MVPSEAPRLVKGMTTSAYRLVGRTIAATLSLCVVLILSACGNSDGSSDREVTPAGLSPSPTSQCAEPATGDEPRLGEINGPGVYRVGEYRVVIPEGMELKAYAGRVEGGGHAS